jgi:hypothetical protein
MSGLAHGRTDRINPTLRSEGARTVIARDLTAWRINIQGPSEAFVEDVVGDLAINNPKAKVWARYLNYERNTEKYGGMAIENNGGMLWLLHGKVEHPGPKVVLSGGSLNEFLGGFYYGSFKQKQADPAIQVTDSALSLVGHRMHSFGKGGWNVFASSTRNGQTQDVRTWAVDQLSIATPEQRAAVKRIEP